MSSYFDTMARCADDPYEVAKLVARQYGAYLRDVAYKIRSERRLEEFHEYISVPAYLLERRLEAQKITPAMFIQELHSLAHNLGSMRIPLKSGKYAAAGDNPWLLTY